MRTLVIGASGYIGTNLVTLLTDRGHTVRAAARNRAVLEARVWPGVECVDADVLREDTLDAVLAGIEVAYYPFTPWEAVPTLLGSIARGRATSAARQSVPGFAVSST